MRTRETSLEELKGLETKLFRGIWLLNDNPPRSPLVPLLKQIIPYAIAQIQRLEVSGSKPDLDDVDLIGYSTRCLFEANLLFRYYAEHEQIEMCDLIQCEMEADDLDILTGVIEFLGKPTERTQQLFSEHSNRKANKGKKTPRISDLAKNTGQDKEYKAFYKLYSKYAHPSAILLMGNYHNVRTEMVREFFMDRAVEYSLFFAGVMDGTLGSTG